jgi:sialate O-acetylesterase
MGTKYTLYMIISTLRGHSSRNCISGYPENLKIKLFNNYILLLLAPIIFFGCGRAIKTSPDIEWRTLPPLPPSNHQTNQPGLAGALIGVSNGALIVAGGTNFPQKPVWDNGIKFYYSDIYILSPNMKWKTGYKLPYKLAYSTTLMVNDQIICIGGHDGSSIRREVFSIKWDNKTENIDFDMLPPLPVPLSNTAGAIIDNTLYIAGGQTEVTENTQKTKISCNYLYSLDLDNLEYGWKKGPSFPGPARKNLLAAAQETNEGQCLFIFSGLSYPPENSEPDVMTEGLRYNPHKQKWTQIAPIAPSGLSPRAVCSGTAIAWGSEHILVFGGRGSQNLASILKTIRKRDNAKKDSDTETLKECEKIIFDYFTNTKFRFNDLILSYNTRTDTWKSLGVYPGQPVTNSRAVWWNNGIVIPSGEIQPGIRTPLIMYGKMTK